MLTTNHNTYQTPVLQPQPVTPEVPIKAVINDEIRQAVVGYAGYQSKQTQAEIYLSVALNEKIELGSDTADKLETMQNIQKQNNAIAAYAQYQEK